MKIKLPGAILLTALLVSTSCGTPAPTAVPTVMPVPTLAPSQGAIAAGAPAACKLFSQADIESALNEKVVLNSWSEPVSDGSLCNYFISSKRLLVVLRKVDTAAIQSTLQDMQAQSKGGQPLAGLGDAAFFAFRDSPQDPGVKTGALYLMKKDIALIIALSDNNLAQAQALQAVQVLAQKAVAQLP